MVARLTLALLLTASTASAQEVHLSVGVMNAGKISNEVTHHVRLAPNGHELYASISVEGKIAGPLRLYAKGTAMPTYLYIWPCQENPCEELDRFNHRPKAGNIIGTPVWMSMATVGLVLSPVKQWVESSGGVGLVFMHAGDYRFWGGMPMAVPVFSADTKVKLPLQRIFATLPNMGIEGGIDWVPAEKGKSRFIVLEEWAGGKQLGQPLEYRQRNWLVIRVGANVAI